MKLARLLLQAFGPFTAKTLEFAASPAPCRFIGHQYRPGFSDAESYLRATQCGAIMNTWSINGFLWRDIRNRATKKAPWLNEFQATNSTRF